jgi:Amt family ammonium transporter
MCTWLLLTWVRNGRPSLVGALTGAISGLVCITPAAGYVPTWSAFVFGVLAGLVCYYAILVKQRFDWDDALDVWAVHGVGGVLGTVLLGVFAVQWVNPDGANGLLAGDPAFFGVQVASAVIAAGYSLGATYLILKLLDRLSPVRVPDEVQARGLDSEIHGEEAYDLT